MRKYIDAGALVRRQQARDRAGRKLQTTWRPYRLQIAKITRNAIGVVTGETELYTDQRNGWEHERERIAFLPRTHLRIVSGYLRPGETIIADLPDWLVERERLKGVEAK